MIGVMLPVDKDWMPKRGSWFARMDKAYSGNRRWATIRAKARAQQIARDYFYRMEKLARALS